jgi:predicted ester cyclase
MKPPTPNEVLSRWFEDETQACLHWEVSGTHKGDFAGIATTKGKVSFCGMSFVTARDGKITEGWDCWDYGALTHTLSSPTV